MSKAVDDRSVAIIGMAGRFPHCDGIDAFWEVLRQGVEVIDTLSEDELIAAGVDRETFADPAYVRRGALIRGLEHFDASFFGITPHDAAVMDPQHRLFLECAWTALEHAGYAPGPDPASVGVFAAAATSRYFLAHLMNNREVGRSSAPMQLVIGNEKDFLCTRVAYHLNFAGPAVAVQTACSASLVAVHLAGQSLLEGECDMALAGGVSITTLSAQGYQFVEGSIASRDGHCRAFDARASGTVCGNGLGIVVLKRLGKALEDGDTIHAVIRGSAINNDGSDKIGFTAPSVNGQAAVITRALEAAGLSADSISYVEAHGTGTVLGDPIEVRALNTAFAGGGFRRCALGSVKTNIGHLDTAAGVAGLIKTTLALTHREIPPSLHFEQANPHIEFNNGHFRVNTELVPWTSDRGPRRAGVSSFGIGGTNAHVILEEAPPTPVLPSRRRYHVIVLSARSESALSSLATGWSHRLIDDVGGAGGHLADVAYTSQVGRRHFPVRRAVVCERASEAVEALQRDDFRETAEKRRVVFMFPGQGSQAAGMARALYQTEAVFTAHVDDCCAQLSPVLGCGLQNILFPAAADEEEANRLLRSTRFTQPALFVVEYALAQQLMAWGAVPEAMIGHSVGEYVAACLSGVMSLGDALALVADRGRMIDALPKGSMLAAQGSEQELAPLLGDDVWLAAVNAPGTCTLSGTDAAIEQLSVRLGKRGTAYQSLHTSHAFHSGMMDPIVADFEQRMKRVRLSVPRSPYISNVTGTWITGSQATDPRYWAEHLRRTVRFADGLAELVKQQGRAYLEVGPGRTLNTLVQHQAPELIAISTLPHAASTIPADRTFWEAIAKLWVSGVDIDWQAVHLQEKRRRVPLPGYPFERQRHWIEAKPDTQRAASETARPSRFVRRDIDQWFYAPTWTRSVREPIAGPAARHLVFANRTPLAQRLVETISESDDVLTVEPGEEFVQTSARTWTLNPMRLDHYEQFVTSLQERGWLPSRITHLWGVGAGGEGHVSQYHGLHSLRSLAYAYATVNLAESTSINVMSSGVHAVTGRERLCPEQATVLGACLVIPLENPNLRCRHIDVELDVDEAVDERLCQMLRREVCSDINETIVAFRGGYRWVQSFEALQLQAAKPIALRENGCYLITGGTGGIGGCFAQYVAQTMPSASLVVVGRAELPPREAWPIYMADHLTDDDPITERVTQLLSLEALGVRTTYVTADVSRDDDVRRIANVIAASGSTVHGIFHAAGIADGDDADPNGEGVTRLMAPKVIGTRRLFEHFHPADCDFALLCSSVASVAPIVRQSVYSGANAFLDTLAAEYRRAGANVVAINWSAWQQIGMAAAQAKMLPPKLREQQLIYLSEAISPADAAAVFPRLLAATTSQVVVTPVDFDVMQRGTAVLNATLTVPSGASSEPTISPARRPELQTAFVPPATAVEQEIARVWQEMFGIESIGVHDNFFDLGGHSMLATQIVLRIRHAFHVELSLRHLLELATVAAVSEKVEVLVREEIEQMSDEDAERMLARLNA